MPSLNETQLNYAFQKVEQFNITSDMKSNEVMTRRGRDGESSQENEYCENSGRVERLGAGCGVCDRGEVFL